MAPDWPSCGPARRARAISGRGPLSPIGRRQIAEPTFSPSDQNTCSNDKLYLSRFAIQGEQSTSQSLGPDSRSDMSRRAEILPQLSSDLQPSGDSLKQALAVLEADIQMYYRNTVNSNLGPLSVSALYLSNAISKRVLPEIARLHPDYINQLKELHASLKRKGDLNFFSIWAPHLKPQGPEAWMQLALSISKAELETIFRAVMCRLFPKLPQDVVCSMSLDSWKRWSDPDPPKVKADRPLMLLHLRHTYGMSDDAMSDLLDFMQAEDIISAPRQITDFRSHYESHDPPPSAATTRELLDTNSDCLITSALHLSDAISERLLPEMARLYPEYIDQLRKLHVSLERIGDLNFFGIWAPHHRQHAPEAWVNLVSTISEAELEHLFNAVMDHLFPSLPKAVVRSLSLDPWERWSDPNPPEDKAFRSVMHLHLRSTYGLSDEELRHLLSFMEEEDVVRRDYNGPFSTSGWSYSAGGI